MRQSVKKLMLVFLICTFIISCFACTRLDDSSNANSGVNSSSQTQSSSQEPDEPKAPTSIDVTNELTLKPGVYALTVTVAPEDSDASFISTLIGEHEFISLVDNELAISEDAEDLYQFTIEVVSAVDESVKVQKTFTVDNRPEEGLYITTKQKEIDAQVAEGKLQLTYTMVPATEVTFALEEEVEGVSVTASGEISVDPLINNGVKFVVVASATVEEKEYKVTYEMSVKNEVEREISTEEELRAIWTGYNPESIARMKNHYVLTADIALTSNWSAIGFKSDTEYEEFNGNFNGNGYTISNFNMNAGWNNGFFYWIGEYGVVENLKLESGKGAGEGLSGMYSGPFAGWCFGSINNCIADVQVTSLPNSAGLHQPIGTFVGTIGVGGTVSNSISLGNAIVDKSGEENPNANYRSGFVASVPGTLSQCLLSSYLLEGSAEFIVGRRESNSDTLEAGMDVIKSASELMTASTFAQLDAESGLGFDRSIWRIVDGAMPCLLNPDFVEPALISVTVNGESASSEITASHGEYAFEAIVADENGLTAGVAQSTNYSIVVSEGALEGAFVLSGNKLKVNGTLAKGGDYCEITASSALNPAVKVTVKLVFEEKLSVIVAQIPEVEYTADGANSIDLSAYVSLLGGTGADLSYAFAKETEGVSLEGSVLTLSSAVNNTATFAIVVTATKGEEVATSEEVTVSVKNLVAKQIATAEDWLAIWTGDNDLSRLHMHNNYVLTADIDLGSSAKVVGLGDLTGYGLHGVIDGAGHTISWSNELSVGWNSGFIARIEKGGVIKNLAFEGALKGFIAGPIGLCYGAVENCFFNVVVTTTHASQPMGSAVAAICGGGLMKNVIAIGQVTTGGGNSGVFGKEHDTDILKPTTINCFALAGTVKDEVNVLSEEAMKTAATFEGFDKDAWYIVDGAYPSLKNANFVAPTSITVEALNGAGNAVNPEDGLYKFAAGEYTFNVAVLPEGASAGWVATLETASEGIAFENGTLKINGNVAVSGDAFTLTFLSAVNPAVNFVLSGEVDNGSASVSVNEGIQSVITYVAGGTNLDLATLVTVNNAKEYTLSARFVTETEGVSLEGTTLSVSDKSNNTATVSVIVTATVNGETFDSSEIAFTIENREFKQIATAQDWLAIWTGDNDLSRLHMHNNYVLTADIDLGSSAKVFGKGDLTGYGLHGVIDGAGYTISWTNELSVGWNSGFIARIEKGGVIKNLAFEGKVLGTIAGPIGLCYGTVENCFFNVAVRTTHASQPMGSAVAAICGGGLMKNVLAIGQVTTGGGNSGVFGKEHDTDILKPMTINCYALAGTVKDEVNVLSEEAMKTASTFEGFDKDAWIIADGAYPSLKKAGFIAPTAFSASVQGANGEVVAENGVYTVTPGAYEIAVSVYPENAESATVSSLVYKGQEGGVTFDAGVLTIDALKVQTGETFTLEFASLVEPSVKVSLSFAINNGAPSIIVSTELPSELTFVEGGLNLDLADYLTVTNASEYTISLILATANEGVVAEGSVLKLNEKSNNTDVVKFTVQVAVGSTVVTSEEISVSIVNTLYKQIATAEDWLAIWTGDNELSRLHMHNNYRLTADIYIASGVKAMGKAWASNSDKGYGLFGTIDGAGHKISWGGEVSVGWNSGFISKIEASGVVKNLSFAGGVYGVIAGPIGLCYGTVENCFFNCSVRGGKDTQPMGSAVAALCGGGVMRNVISIGATSGLFNTSAIYGKTHDESASMPVTAENCYALEGTVTDTINVLSEEVMKTASTFETFDASIWNIADGAYPTLKQQN